LVLSQPLVALPQTAPPAPPLAVSDDVDRSTEDTLQEHPPPKPANDPEEPA
jgi:hypothetical protein